VPIEWKTTDGGNGHHYQLSLTLENAADHFLTWTQARARAQNLSFQGVSGHLVTITSAAENAFLVDRLLPAQRSPAPLLGGFQPPGSAEPDGDWQWVTGEPFGYTNWGPHEPNEALPDADFLIFFDQATVGTWNDVIDLESVYIVEYDTTPSVPVVPIVQAHAFSASTSNTIAVSPFDPSLGTLNRVDVAIIGTLVVQGTTLPFLAGPFGSPVPYQYRVKVTQDFAGLAGRYFDFSGPAEFLFQATATGAGETFEIASSFRYDFSFTESSDLVGFAALTTTSNPASLIPPAAGVLGTRADFLLALPPLDEILLTQTWQPIATSGGPAPVVSLATAQGTLTMTYHYTP
jgi:hypothetical protein